MPWLDPALVEHRLILLEGVKSVIQKKKKLHPQRRMKGQVKEER